MNEQDNQWLDHLPPEILDGIQGNYLDSYAIALEGWRRGLTLKWHVKDNEKFKEMETWFVDEPGQLFSLFNGQRTHYFFRSRGDLVSNEAVQIGKDKTATKQILKQHNIQVPEGKSFPNNTAKEDIIQYAKQIGFPIVIKPKDGSLGKGVFTYILSEGELDFSINELKAQFPHEDIIVEKHIEGDDLRLYVVDNQVVGAIKRLPPNVTGDGKSTIRELVRQKNNDRKKNPRLINCQIKNRKEIKEFIGRKGLTLDSIPEAGKQIFLSKKCNISMGGDPIDVLDSIPNEVKELAIQSLQSIPGLTHGAVDILMNETNGELKKAAVLEINPTAQLGGILFPIKGKSRDIPKALVDYYFPETAPITIDNYSMYFPFYDVIEPLINRQSAVTTVTPAPVGKIYKKKYIVTGEVSNIGYHRGLRKQAFERGLHGYVLGLEGGDMEVVVAGTDPEMVDDFENGFYEDPERGQVEYVYKSNFTGYVNIGFEVKRELKTQIDEIKQMRKDLERIESDIKKSEKERRKLEQSLSWKVSTPIRIVGGLVKKVKK
ncbi:acylphosphatase [Allobacillus halotolerans]|uniref:Acylphosphatase n=1 Tax=Allobacillus halotolerans TaxID=570278 RepID=A0ABS6GRZ6_9BACI|nr:acylphosphatase [Allobacillus halotolerans]MBU6081886.1 acylphosphatase [Allobacillus halotolerans]